MAEAKKKVVRKKAVKKVKEVEPVSQTSTSSAESLASAEEKPKEIHKPKPTKKEEGPKYYGTGRRKTSIARVWLRPGSGNFVINGRSMADYLRSRRVLETTVHKPLAVTDNLKKFDVLADTYGGGFSSQADAISLGIARALVSLNPELKTVLRKDGLLTRDPRAKERKKYGLKRARKAFQYSKR